MIQQEINFHSEYEQLTFNFENTMPKLGPKFSITENNRQADVYDRGSHYTIECYKDRIWQSVMTTLTEDEARKLSNNFVMETK